MNKSLARELTAQMTLEEKASLCSGLDTWRLKPVGRLGLNSIMVTDGPHGLRKQPEEADHLGLNKSLPAVCFPAASATACSFDRDLLFRIGAAMGEECLQENVAVLLGPGVNIKRSPLCGRNFEYFSEDPFLAGELAASLINGVQSKGIGTSLKHYAANNQESRRMTVDSVVDERALREIYLSAFETAVKKAQPWTVMCSYNRIAGEYVSDSRRFLTDILRGEWGFDGLVVTDWGACNDRVQGVRAGCDLEMPSSNGYNDKEIVKAVESGALDMETLDATVERIVRLILDAQEHKKEGYAYDENAHHALARKAAAQSCVLLKNDGGILPLKAGSSLAVIGQFAKTPRYQGEGSSHINPTRLDCAFDALQAGGVSFDYADGYDSNKPDEANEALIEEACAAARGKDAVLIFAGLPPAYESEGFDRTKLDMPASHDRLIEAVCAVNPNTAVVLQLGAPVTMPWAEQVKAILLAYLGGQGGGSGVADVLLGDVNPSGKLAETFPLALRDTPSYLNFPGGTKTVEYRESIYVGYRYYDAAGKEVLYPFGHGLSYTTFEYSGLRLNRTRFLKGGTLEASFTVKNTGSVRGAEVAELYVRAKASKLFRAPRELKGFEKLMLEPGEAKTVTIELNDRSFSYYNAEGARFAVEGGAYAVEIGASSRDIRLNADIDAEGDGLEGALLPLYETLSAYARPAGTPLNIPNAEFSALLGRSLPVANRQKGEPFNINSTLKDMDRTLIGKIMLAQVKKMAKGMLGDDVDEGLMNMFSAMLAEMPIRSIAAMSGGALTPTQGQGLIDIANGRLLTGVKKLMAKEKKKA
ncbi:MAG: glycoside hydrolase family 3 C-terminal domain-containing protein [Eubacteriales bacterium]|nr:glycoside hydrolase family 3 C-terminal domain-containing protein [Eubacteriales bacterium]